MADEVAQVPHRRYTFIIEVQAHTYDGLNEITAMAVAAMQDRSGTDLLDQVVVTDEASWRASVLDRGEDCTPESYRAEMEAWLAAQAAT